MAPRQFTTNNEWYACTQEMQSNPPLDDQVTISPDTVTANEAPLEWQITYEVDSEPIRRGEHLSIEIPLYFTLDHGRPYPVGTTHVKHIDEAQPGYAAAIDVKSPSPTTTVAFAVSNLNRFSVLDIEVREGAVHPGEQIEVILGDRGGSRLRAPSFSQQFRFATGVHRPSQSGYRGVRTPPVVDVHGNDASDLRLIAPSTPSIGDEIAVDVIPVDADNHNPSSTYAGTISLSTTGDLEAPDSVTISGESGLDPTPRDALLDDTYRSQITITGERPGYVTGIDTEHGLIGQSNPVAPDWSPRNVYWGDIHVQGYDSIGVGTTAEMFEWARNAEGLDFCATANHYGGRHDVTANIWNELVDTTNAYNSPGRFATLISYEWGGAYGHRNVYFRDDEGGFFGKAGSSSQYPTPRTMEGLWDHLDEYDGPALAFGHHPKFCGRVSWDRFHDDYQRLIEIYSAWGDSERGGPWSVRAGLNRGHRVGFTGGTDTHKGQPGSGTHPGGDGAGLTAVYTEQLTREAVFDALAARRTYATTGARMLLDWSINNLAMGEEQTATAEDRVERSGYIRAIGTSPITEVDVICNGQVLESMYPNDRSVSWDWTDTVNWDDIAIDRDHPDGQATAYYYARITQADGHRAWASPIWFLDGPSA